MFSRRLKILAGLLGLGLLLTWPAAGRTYEESVQPAEGQAQAAVPQEEGVEVLARGPIHEAYAEPVDYHPQPSKIVPKRPPDPIEELPPDQKPAGDNVQWFPGYWAWDDDRSDFIWVSGIWRIAPPDRQWAPGHWTEAATGWQWSPGFWTPIQQQNQVEYLPTPPEPVEAAASVPAPNDQSVFVPGTWVYRETRYVWRPGYWVDYRPGWVWIPAHYVWTPAGYVFVDGYWDFELDRRGLLFAPVYFTRPLWTRARWFFRPYVCVYDDFLLASLFIRPGFGHYYFGDYFEAAYRSRGFVAWINFRVGPGGYDPLFSYYRSAYWGDPRWMNNMRTLYAGRFNGTVPRPPVTLVQQTTVINNNVTINNVTNIRTVAGLAPLTSVDRRVVNLRPVTPAQQQQGQLLAQGIHQAARQRNTLEMGLVSKGTAPIVTKAAPQVVQVDLPKLPPRTNVPQRHQPPPLPVAPRGVTTLPARAGAGGPTGGQPSVGTGQPSGTKPTSPTRAGGRVEPGSITGQPVPKTEPRRESKTLPKYEGKPPAPPPPPRIESKPAPRIESKPAPRIESKPAPRVEPKQPVPPPKTERPPAKPPSPPPKKTEPGKDKPKGGGG
jgi:hypothetical protein